MTESGYSIKEVIDTMSRELQAQMAVIRSDIADYRKDAVTKAELQNQLQAIQRDIDRIDRQGRDDLRVVKNDVEVQMREHREAMQSQMSDQRVSFQKAVDELKEEMRLSRADIASIVTKIVAVGMLIVAIAGIIIQLA